MDKAAYLILSGSTKTSGDGDGDAPGWLDASSSWRSGTSRVCCASGSNQCAFGAASGDGGRSECWDCETGVGRSGPGEADNLGLKYAGENGPRVDGGLLLV
jgi:hypothetical protein